MTEFLTVAEVAATFRVNRETVRRWIRSGALPATRIGRDYRVQETAVRSLLEQEPA